MHVLQLHSKQDILHDKINALLPSSVSLIFRRKNNTFTPTNIKVYTLINNMPSKTKWHNKVEEPLYTISGIPICLTFAKYNFYWESNLNGSCKLMLIAFTKPLALQE